MEYSLYNDFYCQYLSLDLKQVFTTY